MEKRYFVSEGNSIGHNSDHLFESFGSIHAAEKAGDEVFGKNWIVWFVNSDGEAEAV